MCGRTSLYLPQAVVESRFEAEAAAPLEPRYNIAPFEDLPVVPDAAPETIEQFEWGFLPSWADGPDDSYRPINARGETVAEKPMFRDAVAETRCLVLADGFYEWQDQPGGPSQPYRIERADEEPFAMAGLWNEWEDNSKQKRTVTIVTTDANEVLEPIHDRMPVILPVDVERDWLRADTTADAVELLQPYPEDDLDTYPISRAVNDPKNDSAAVIEPVEPDTETQTGLDDFA